MILDNDISLQNNTITRKHFLMAPLSEKIKMLAGRVRRWLSGLSFRTGVIVLALCIPFYILSFAQMLLPVGAGTKTVLWVILFGLAKTFQYGGLTIIGAEGISYLRKKFRRKSCN